MSKTLRYVNAALLLLLAGCATASEQRYRQPIQLDDGLSTAAAKDLGLGHEPLERMTDALRRGVEYRDIHALLIMKDGRLVYEEYFAGEDEHGRLGPLGRVVFDRNTLHDVRSVTKSVVSTLVGIAVGTGAIPTVDAPVLDYFPDYAGVATPEWRGITLRHALDMSAGLEWREWGAGAVSTMREMNRSPDMIRFILERRVVHAPGTRWTYNGGLTQILGEVVQRATGKPLVEYARAMLFEPLGITDVEWMPNAGRSSTDADSGLRLRARDLVKLGLLYAQRGRWRGRQIVPAEWINASLQRAVSLSDSTVEYRNDASGELGYGHQWWHARFAMPYGSFTAHSAQGNGGQTVFISPDHGLIAIVLAGRYENSHDVDRLMLERVVPWAAGAGDSIYRFWSGRVVRRVAPGEWPEIALSPEERARYLGTYTHEGEQVHVSEEAGVLRITPLPGMEGDPFQLVPMGDHVFAFGFYENGRLTKIYWPDGVLEFQMTDGRAMGYIDRAVDGEVFGKAERVR